MSIRVPLEGSGETPGCSCSTPRAGHAKPGTLHWVLGPDGHQRIALRLTPRVRRLALPAPRYLDSDTGAVGPLDCGMPATLAAQVLAAPALPPEAIPQVIAELGTHLPALPLPLDHGAPEPLGGPPERRLLLTTTTLAADPWRLMELLDRRHA